MLGYFFFSAGLISWSRLASAALRGYAGTALGRHARRCLRLCRRLMVVLLTTVRLRDGGAERERHRDRDKDRENHRDPDETI